MLMCWVCFPRWVMISMYKEYRAVRIIFSPRRIMDRLDHENIAMTINNSPIKLMVGGRAKLVRLANSHQAAISGSNICNPRARIIVRLCTRS